MPVPPDGRVCLCPPCACLCLCGLRQGAGVGGSLRASSTPDPAATRALWSVTTFPCKLQREAPLLLTPMGVVSCHRPGPPFI